MKNMVSLIDTNVIINFITKREDPYKEECFEVMRLCADEVFDGYIAFHSLSTIWYVIRKQRTEEEARTWLSNICDMLIVTGATQEQIRDAIKNSNFHDFEDCLQDECAVHVNADYIVTCNVKDFNKAKTTVVTPDIFLKIVTGDKR
ncbi:MAG: PIN domain-containing protein [Ruminococcus flavefaciens]|nr:PIN domain-containing protein [Ruminococcus flavefaciens]